MFTAQLSPTAVTTPAKKNTVPGARGSTAPAGSQALAPTGSQNPADASAAASNYTPTASTFNSQAAPPSTPAGSAGGQGKVGWFGKPPAASPPAASPQPPPV